MCGGSGLFEGLVEKRTRWKEEGEVDVCFALWFRRGRRHDVLIADERGVGGGFRRILCVRGLKMDTVVATG